MDNRHSKSLDLDGELLVCVTRGTGVGLEVFDRGVWFLPVWSRVCLDIKTLVVVKLERSTGKGKVLLEETIVTSPNLHAGAIRWVLSSIETEVLAVELDWAFAIGKVEQLEFGVLVRVGETGTTAGTFSIFLQAGLHVHVDFGTDTGVTTRDSHTEGVVAVRVDLDTASWARTRRRGRCRDGSGRGWGNRRRWRSAATGPDVEDCMRVCVCQVSSKKRSSEGGIQRQQVFNYYSAYIPWLSLLGVHW